MNPQQPLEFVIWAALAFLASTVVIFLTTLIMRVVKTGIARKSDHFEAESRKDLNNLILQQVYSSGMNPSSAFQFQLAELTSKIDGSGIRRQIIIDQIMIQRENLSGGAADFLRHVYILLGLHRLSIQKLKSLRWQVRMQGIHELASMNYREAMAEIRSACRAGKTVPVHARMSLVRLDWKNEISFLDNYTGELTDWMQLNLHYCLRDVDPRELPEFSRWFNNPNISVAIFSINMSGIFGQSSAVPQLTTLLLHSNSNVVDSAIGALDALEAHELVSPLLSVADRWWSSEKVMTSLVRCLGKIVLPVDGFATLMRFLDHSAYEVRFEAVKAICCLGPAQVREMEAYNSARGFVYSGLLRHTTEPLLN